MTKVGIEHFRTAMPKLVMSKLENAMTKRAVGVGLREAPFREAFRAPLANPSTKRPTSLCAMAAAFPLIPKTAKRRYSTIIGIARRFV